MADLIQKPSIIQPAGNKPKRIAEYVGRVTTAKQFETIPMYRLRRS